MYKILVAPTAGASILTNLGERREGGNINDAFLIVPGGLGCAVFTLR